MTTLHDAARQALEALWHYHATEWGADSPAGKAIHVLQAALAQEQAEQTWVCPDSPEHRYKKPGHCEDCGKTLVRSRD